jgi:AcrR family transcriptional regulator
MKVAVAAPSAIQSRTRRCILDAAALTLSRERAATLADIADAAGVGRTTLHRYFPDRETLLNAVVEDCWQAIEQAVRDAAIDHGPPVDAMHRLVIGMADVGDRLLFLFGDPRTPQANTTPDRQTHAKDPILDLIERGQQAGLFDSEASTNWIRSVLWALVYTACEAARDGRLPRHGIAPTVIRTLTNGIITQPRPS